MGPHKKRQMWVLNGGKSQNHLGSNRVTDITDKRTIITASEHNANGKKSQVIPFWGTAEKG